MVYNQYSVIHFGMSLSQEMRLPHTYVRQRLRSGKPYR